MKSGIACILLAVTLFGTCLAQEAPKTPIVADTSWRITITSGLTATQTAYSENWTGGEAGSFSWAFTSLTEAGRQISPKLNSTTVLKLAFGQTLTQSRINDSTTHWSKPVKSTDLIDLESVLRFTLHKYVDPYMAFRLESQFYDGANPNKKLYLSPMKLTESGGFMRVFKDDPKTYTLKSRLGFALRQIITKAIVDSALNTKSSSTNDGGLESVTDFKAQLSKNLAYASKLTLYKALFFSKSKEAVNDNWKAVDMNWEHAVAASITKYLQTLLYFQLLYDKEIDSDVRIKETLGLGLSWKISK